MGDMGLRFETIELGRLDDGVDEIGAYAGERATDRSPIAFVVNSPADSSPVAAKNSR